jgi:hypothetical protein
MVISEWRPASLSSSPPGRVNAKVHMKGSGKRDDLLDAGSQDDEAGREGALRHGQVDVVEVDVIVVGDQAVVHQDEDAIVLVNDPADGLSDHGLEAEGGDPAEEDVIAVADEDEACLRG